MYLIELEFLSKTEHVYTQIKETATTKSFSDYKKERLVNQWFDILCPHINFTNFKNDLSKDDINKDEEYKPDRDVNLKLLLIKNYLDLKNFLDGKKRHFDIKITGPKNKVEN